MWDAKDRERTDRACGCDDTMASVECTKGYSDYFFMTVYGEPDTASRQSTKRPLEPIFVHDCLEMFGLEAQTKQKWKWKKSDGVMKAEESLYGPSDSASDRIITVNAPRRPIWQHVELIGIIRIVE